MSKSKSFKWLPDEPPPQLEEHSKAKLTVLRRYLREYFNRLNVGFARDEFKFDLVDGFAGGGVFQYGDETVPGTPLIMLEESKAAITRLNKGRTKSIHCDFKYYFVDIEKNHTDYLKKVLKERGYPASDKRITIRNGSFRDEASKIINAIRRRQPRAGRSLFLLDQTGFSQVELETVSYIFRELPKAEVILTFSADALMNFLKERPQFVQAVAPLDLKTRDVTNLIRLKEGEGGKALVQRTLLQHIKSDTGATYYTPFFIRPKQSRRALWFIHLSRHPTARDVMVQCHWASSNTFEHHGPGGFGMLGWDNLRSEKSLPLFRFGELEKKELDKQLLDDMPQKLYSLASEDPLTIDAMRHVLANETAAPFSVLEEILRILNKEGEIDIIDPDGRKRRRDVKHIQLTDRIVSPKQLIIPALSRRKKR